MFLVAHSDVKLGCIMYMLSSVFFKTMDTYLNLEIRVVCREILAFKYVFIVFFSKKSDEYLYL